MAKPKTEIIENTNETVEEKILFRLVNWIRDYKELTKDNLQDAVKYFKVAWKYALIKDKPDIIVKDTFEKKDKIKRLPTAWNLFVKENSSQLAIEHPGMTLSERWATLSAMYAESK